MQEWKPKAHWFLGMSGSTRHTNKRQLIANYFAFCVAIVLNLDLARSQEKPQPSSSNLTQIQVAIQSLKDGEIESTFRTLAPLAESSTSIFPIEPDELSTFCGALNRIVAQQSSEQQFELLSKWTFPTDSPASVRMLAALVPTEAPPTEFARALGERPQANSFPIAAVGPIQGIYSTAWSLVAAARESGRLKKLQQDLANRVERKVQNAKNLLMLVSIADDRADVANVEQFLNSRVAQIKAAADAKSPATPEIDRHELVLAIAALRRTELRPVVEQYFDLILRNLKGDAATAIRPFLRKAHAIACLLADGTDGSFDAKSILDTQFHYWIPASNRVLDSAWLTQEGQLLHLAGSSDDVLISRYPITGDFNFEFEAQIGGFNPTEGGVGYGGMRFLANGAKGEFTAQTSSGQIIGTRWCPFAHRPDNTLFHRWSINSTDKTFTTAVNLHPMWITPNWNQPSPWIGMVSRGEHRSIFRNFKLTGKPVIPAEVKLISEQFSGWQSDAGRELVRAYETSQAARWTVVDGMIRISTDPSLSDSGQHHLSYMRPLLDGETIRYDFFYEAGKTEVSPALGRVAFVLHPDGVKIHWIARQDDWTTLPTDHMVVEPLRRRGPKPLPFKTSDWNQLSISRVDQSVTLTLNNVVIYQRPIDWMGDHQFGLYRHNLQADVKVRDVVLSGDWPKQLPGDFFQDPFASSRNEIPQTARRALNRVFGETDLASNVYEVRRQSLSMPLAERFQYLSEWILPGPNHAHLRMNGEFTPTRPAPEARHRNSEHADLGAQIVAPVVDWLEAAKELGKLEDCRKRVESITALDSEQQRAKFALLLLLSFDTQEASVQEALWDQFFDVLKKEPPSEAESHWPDLILATRVMARFANHARCAELLAELATQRAQRWRGSDTELWLEQLWKLYESVLQDKRIAANPSQTALRDWIPVDMGQSKPFGQGHPESNWQRVGDMVVKTSGHDRDFLFYRYPLTGDFQFECDMYQPGQYRISVLAGGSYIGPDPTFSGLQSGTVHTPQAMIPFEPALTNMGKPIHFRLAIEGHERTVHLNGRKIHQATLSTPRDPWLALRAPNWHPGCAARIQILGHPTIPRAVQISRVPDLNGWVEYHNDAHWAYSGGAESGADIIGKVNLPLKGTSTEGLLRYQRPLEEGDTIEFDFFYEPGRVETAPALDRLAFLLDPSGIREHWITDGRYGPVEMAPDNVSDRAADRRGGGALPLIINDWNNVSLTIRNSTALLRLNGQPVYERHLESVNRRVFGLFHYVDTESRVRNVVLKGDWPETLPGIADQELAGSSLDWLDAERPAMKSVFTHRFDTEGLPDTYFSHFDSNRVVVSAKGVSVATSGTVESPNVVEILSRFSASGNFDMEASFQNLELTAPLRYCGILLRTMFDEAEMPVYDIHRLENSNKHHVFQASQSLSQPRRTGGGMWRAEISPWETYEGRLRLARRGTKLHYLIADEATSPYRLVHTEEVGAADLAKDGIRLHTFACGGASKVVWKSITLRAEKLTWYPLPPKTQQLQLKVVDAMSGEATTIAEPAAAGFTHLGSPEWSRDGRLIALDMSNGSTATSRIFVVGADGKNLRDVGPGCMPSFSADGKQIAFSMPGDGIMTMNSDGTNRKELDDSGWGTQWSPDGKWLAYGKGGNITIFNVQTKATRQLLTGEEAIRYNYIYWNLAWSHDSRAVAFKAQRSGTNQQELAVAKLDGPDQFLILHPDAGKVQPDITFSPSNDSVIAAIDMGNGKGRRLCSLSRTKTVEIKPVELLPANQPVDGVAWSRDGRFVAVAIPFVTEPVEWRAEMKAGQSAKQLQ